MILHRFFLSVFILLATALAWAGPREDLLALDHRPTVQEIKNAFGGTLPEQNPFGTANPALQATIKSNIPSVIATFEKAFPGATYSPLGRDSVLLGDMIDAFYQSLGQHRIVRASASGASLTTERDLLDFMKGLGVDPAHLDQAPPFIMFDQTNFRNNSQSTTYLNAIYGECLKAKCDPRTMVEKFNFLNTGSSKGMYNNNVITPKTDIDSFVKTQADAKKGKAIWAIQSVTVDQSLVYTTEYHETFNQFHRDDYGNVTTSPGPMGKIQDRMQILADVFETIKTVSTPEFLTAVKFNALAYHYEFPLQRVLNEEKRHLIRSNTIDAGHLHELYIETLKRQITKQIEMRLSSRAHADAIKLSLHEKISEDPADGWMLTLASSLKIVRVNQMDKKDFAALVFQAFENMKSHEIMRQDFQSRIVKFLKQNPDAGDALRDGFSEAAEGKNQDAVITGETILAVRDAYLASSGMSASEFVSIESVGDIKEFRRAVTEEDVHKYSGKYLFDQIYKRADKIHHLSSSFGSLLTLKTVLQFVDQGHIDQTYIDNALWMQINEMNPDSLFERKSLVDVLKRSSLASKAFNERCFGFLIADENSWGRLLKKYEIIFNDLNGTSSDEFTKKYIDASLKLKAKRDQPKGEAFLTELQTKRKALLKSGEISSTWLESLREAVVAADSGQLSLFYLGSLISQIMDQPIFDSNDETGVQFRNRLKEIILAHPIARQAFEGPTLFTQSSQYEKYAGFRKSVENSLSDPKPYLQLFEEAKLNEIRLTFQHLLDNHATSEAISESIGQSVHRARFTNSNQAWFLFLSLTAEAAEQYRMSSGDVINVVLSVMDKVDMSEPANRANFLALIKKHDVLRRIFTESLFARIPGTVGERKFIEAFRLLYLNYASLEPLAFKKLYLQKQIDRKNAKPPLPHELVTQFTRHIELLGPDDVSQMWIYVFQRYAERVKAGLTSQADYAAFISQLLVQRSTLINIDDDFKSGLKKLYESNLEFKKVFDGDVLKGSSSHPSYVYLFDKIHKNLVGKEGADYESHKLDLSAEYRLSQSANSEEHIRAIRNETAALKGLDPARALKKGFELAAIAYRKNQIDDAGMIGYLGSQFQNESSSKIPEIREAFRQAIETSPEWKKIWFKTYRLMILENAHFFSLWQSYELTNDEWMKGDADAKARQALRHTLSALASPSIPPLTFKKSLANWFSWQLKRPDWSSQPENLAILFMQEITAPTNEKVMGQTELGASLEVVLQNLDENAIANIHPLSETVKSHPGLSRLLGSELKAYFEASRIRPQGRLSPFESTVFLKKALILSTAAGLRANVEDQLALQITADCEGRDTSIVQDSSAFGRAFILSVKSSFMYYDGGEQYYSRVFELLEKTRSAGQIGSKDEYNVLVQLLSNGTQSVSSHGQDLQSSIRKSAFAQALIRRWSPSLFIDSDPWLPLDIKFLIASMPETFNATEVHNHLVDILFANIRDEDKSQTEDSKRLNHSKIFSWMDKMRSSHKLSPDEKEWYTLQVLEKVYSDQFKDLILPSGREYLTLNILGLIDSESDSVKQRLREVALRSPVFREYFTTQLDRHLNDHFDSYQSSKKSSLLEVVQELIHGRAPEVTGGDHLFTNYIDTLKLVSDVEKRTDSTYNGEAYAAWSGKVFASAPNLDERRTLILNSVKSLLHGVDNGKFKGIDIQLALRAALVNFSLQDQVLESEFHRLVSEDPRIQILWRNSRGTLKNDPATADAVKRLQARNVNQCVVAIKRIFSQ